MEASNANSAVNANNVIVEIYFRRARSESVSTRTGEPYRIQKLRVLEHIGESTSEPLYAK